MDSPLSGQARLKRMRDSHIAHSTAGQAADLNSPEEPLGNAASATDITVEATPVPSAGGKHQRRRSRSRGLSLTTSAKNLNSVALWVLLAALALTILEGALRKWVGLFGEGTWRYAAYFSKDIAFVALLLIPVHGRMGAPLQVFRDWSFAGCALLLLGAMISATNSFNPVGAALTLRAAVFLPFLACLVVPRLAGISLRWAVWLLGGLTIANCALAVVQNRLPADHVLNRYASDTQAIVAFETGVRATGTFSYITGLGVMSSVGIWAGMALLSLAANHWHRVVGWAAIVAGFGCALASISRGPIVIAAAVVCFWVLFSRASISVLVRSVVAGGVLIALLIVFDVVPIFSELGQNLRERQEEAGDSFRERAFGQFGEVLVALKAAPMGTGLGTEQVGGNYYTTGERSFTSFESQMPRLVLETGVLGLAGFLVICAGALLALQAAKREAPSYEEKAMLLATQLLLLPIFYTNIVFNHTASAFVWIIFAAVLAASRLSPEKPEAYGRKRNTRRSRKAHEKAEIDQQRQVQL